MSDRKVLLTGFEPFHDQQVNESSQVVKEILNSGLEGVQISHKILTVDLAGSTVPSKILGFENSMLYCFSDFPENQTLFNWKDMPEIKSQ